MKASDRGRNVKSKLFGCFDEILLVRSGLRFCPLEYIRVMSRELDRDIAGSNLIKPEFSISEYQAVNVADNISVADLQEYGGKTNVKRQVSDSFLYKADLLKRSWMSVKVTI